MSDQENLGSIKARFWVTQKHCTIFTTYRGSTLQLRWARGEDDEEAARNVYRLLKNMPDVVKDCINEAFVQSQTKGIQAELDELFSDTTEEPDE